jgi:hypothetical protein
MYFIIVGPLQRFTKIKHMSLLYQSQMTILLGE